MLIYVNITDRQTDRQTEIKSVVRILTKKKRASNALAKTVSPSLPRRQQRMRPTPGRHLQVSAHRRVTLRRPERAAGPPVDSQRTAVALARQSRPPPPAPGLQERPDAAAEARPAAAAAQAQARDERVFAGPLVGREAVRFPQAGQELGSDLFG